MDQSQAIRAIKKSNNRQKTKKRARQMENLLNAVKTSVLIVII